jgi:hypothetical protein
MRNSLRKRGGLSTPPTMNEINLSQSGLSIGRLNESCPSLSELAAASIADHLFSKEHNRLGFDVSALYALPDSALSVLVDQLRRAPTPFDVEVVEAIGEYVLGILMQRDEPDAFTPESARWTSLRKKIPPSLPISSLAALKRFDDDELQVRLRAFALAEYLSLSRAEHFDSVFLSVVGAWSNQIPAPTALPHLRSLFVRDGLYDVSVQLLVISHSKKKKLLLEVFLAFDPLR